MSHRRKITLSCLVRWIGVDLEIETSWGSKMGTPFSVVERLDGTGAWHTVIKTVMPSKMTRKRQLWRRLWIFGKTFGPTFLSFSRATHTHNVLTGHSTSQPSRPSPLTGDNTSIPSGHSVSFSASSATWLSLTALSFLIPITQDTLLTNFW